MKTRGRLFQRVLLALFALYPGPFRRDFGRDIADTHVDRYRAARRHGRVAGIACVLAGLVDVCWGAVHEWKAAAGDAVPRCTGSSTAILQVPARLWRESRQDTRYAARLLARSPGFSITVMLTLALGVGANMAMFSVVHGILLRPLPFPDAERLATVWLTYPHWREREVLRQFWDSIPLAYPEYERLREGTTSYEAVSIYRADRMTLTGLDRPEVITVGSADDALPAVLGIGPAIGRWFSRAEAAPGGERLAVLTHAFWRTRFGGDASVLGRRLHLDDQPYSVIGILPDSFRFGRPADSAAPAVWVPLGGLNLPFDDTNHVFDAIARLRVGSSFTRAEEETTGLLRGDRPPELRGARVLPRKEEEVGAFARSWSCCGERSGSFSSSRASTSRTCSWDAVWSARRNSRCGTRLAPAAAGLHGSCSPRACCWPWLAGRSVCSWRGRAPAHSRPGCRPTCRVCTRSRLTGRCSPLPWRRPCWRACCSGCCLRSSPAPVPRRRGCARVASRSAAVRACSTGSWVCRWALALSLLVGAGLLTRTLAELWSVDPGFDREGLLTFQISLPATRYQTPEQAEAWFARLDAALSGHPGVTGVATTSVLPLSGRSASNSVWPASFGPEKGPKPEVERRVVSPGYLDVLGVRLTRGRGFTPADDQASTPVAIVSRAAVRRLWEGRDPIGDRLEMSDRWWTVVGVVDDVQDQAFRAAAEATIYVPASQWSAAARTVILRTAVPPLTVGPDVHRIVGELDPELPVARLRSMEQVAATSVAGERFRAGLLGALAALAAVLAAVGLYGVVSQGVVRRSRELGIRMALGAERHRVLGLVLRQAALTVAAGLAAGLAVSVPASRVLDAFLFGVPRVDLVTYAVTIVLMTVVALAAALVPAWRASRVDPVAVLRQS